MKIFIYSEFSLAGGENDGFHIIFSLILWWNTILIFMMEN